MSYLHRHHLGRTVAWGAICAWAVVSLGFGASSDARRRWPIHVVPAGTGWRYCYARESAQYIVCTNVSSRRAAEALQWADALQGALKEHFAGLGADKLDVPKVAILLFRSREGFKAYEAKYSRCKSDMGYYHPGRREIVLNGECGKKPGSARGTGLSRALSVTLLHEGTHQVADCLVPLGRQPPWFAEGLAEYFEVSQKTPSGKRLLTGLVHTANLQPLKQALKEGQRFSLDYLVTMKCDAFQGPAEDRNLLYAQCWSLVHFFLRGEKGKHKQRFLDYAARLRKGEDPVEAFDAVIGDDAGIGDRASFESAWLKHIRELGPPPAKRRTRGARGRPGRTELRRIRDAEGSRSHGRGRAGCAPGRDVPACPRDPGGPDRRRSGLMCNRAACSPTIRHCFSSEGRPR